MTLSTALELLGAGLIAIGLALIWPPLAWLFLGACCFGASWLIERSTIEPRQGDQFPQEPSQETGLHPETSLCITRNLGDVAHETDA